MSYFHLQMTLTAIPDIRYFKEERTFKACDHKQSRKSFQHAHRTCQCSLVPAHLGVWMLVYLVRSKILKCVRLDPMIFFTFSSSGANCCTMRTLWALLGPHACQSKTFGRRLQNIDQMMPFVYFETQPKQPFDKMQAFIRALLFSRLISHQILNKTEFT